LEIPALPDLSGFLPGRSKFAKGAPCTGFGYDVHRYVTPDAPKARPMKLGGVPIAGAPCVEAHSDGDVLIHALMDAVLGCLGLGDIGLLFPDTDACFESADSALLLSEVMELARKAGLTITHVDVTIIAQVPKISPHRELIRKNLCALLKLEKSALNIKATTEEYLGFTGRKEGIKAVAVVSALK
jgi:2-C-methyl-D-erythritol 4-phosphate cytidylyltransferase/2-C-methyl-D-erythritol 2,4-cyclodiphosphate synthase